jgi:Tfp pilus assembly protein PilZ
MGRGCPAVLACARMPLVSVESREHPRARARIKVAYHFGGSTGVGRSGDISEGGLFLECERPAQVGARVYLRLYLPGTAGQEPLKVIGTVTRSVNRPQVAGARGARPTGMGIRFEVAYSRTRDVLADFVGNLLEHAGADAPPEVELLEEDVEASLSTWVARFPQPPGTPRAQTLSAAEVERVFAFQVDSEADEPGQEGATLLRVVVLLAVLGAVLWAVLKYLV